jgi:hypothetical protein
MPVHWHHASHLQTQDPLQPLVRQQSCCCYLWLFTSLWLIVTLSQRPPLIVADCNHLATLTEESVQKKKKAEKKFILFTAKQIEKANLDQIFSKSRSGTVAHKNKKNYGSNPV